MARKLTRKQVVDLIQSYAAADGPKDQARVQRIYVENRLSYAAFIAAARHGWAIHARVAKGETYFDAARPKTPGHIAYEEDVRRCPNHHDRSARRSWAEIGGVAQWSWERDPTPREHRHLQRVEG